MKKTYISPSFVSVELTSRIIMAPGSLNIDGDSGTASFYNENATGEAMAKGVTDVNLWDNEW